MIINHLVTKCTQMQQWIIIFLDIQVSWNQANKVAIKQLHVVLINIQKTTKRYIAIIYLTLLYITIQHLYLQDIFRFAFENIQKTSNMRPDLGSFKETLQIIVSWEASNFMQRCSCANTIIMSFTVYDISCWHNYHIKCSILFLQN